MNVVVIVLIVIVVVLAVAALAFNPVLQRRADAAITEAQERLGGRDRVRLLEPKAVGFGSDPEEAGGLRGQGVLAASDDTLVFVTWAPRRTHALDRSAITSVSTSAPDARVLDKAALIVGFDDPQHPGTVSWRVAEIAKWLDVLGYDWGPEGRPALDVDAE